MLLNPKKFVSDVIESVKGKKDFVYTEEYFFSVLEQFGDVYEETMSFIDRYIADYLDYYKSEDEIKRYRMIIYKDFDNVLIEGLLKIAISDGEFDITEALMLDRLEGYSYQEYGCRHLFNNHTDIECKWSDICDDIDMVQKILDEYVKSEERDLSWEVVFESLFNEYKVSDKEMNLILESIIDRIIEMGLIFARVDGNREEVEDEAFHRFITELQDYAYNIYTEKKYKNYKPENSSKLQYSKLTKEKYGKDKTRKYKEFKEFEEFYKPNNKIIINKKSGNLLTYKSDKKEYINSIPYIEVHGDGFMTSGSGVVISEDGYCLSCAHVFEDCNEAYVKIGKENSVYCVGSVFLLEDTDLAIFKLEKGKYKYNAIDIEYDEPEVGEKIRCLGFPIGSALSDDILNLKCSMTEGVISSFQISRGIKTINLDIAARHGNSGGPIVLESNDKVIGLLHGAQIGQDLDSIIYSHPIYYLKEYFEVADNEECEEVSEETIESNANNSDQRSEKKVRNEAKNPYEELKKLKELLDLEIITKEEFDEKKKKLMDMI